MSHECRFTRNIVAGVERWPSCKSDAFVYPADLGISLSLSQDSKSKNNTLSCIAHRPRHPARPSSRSLQPHSPPHPQLSLVRDCYLGKLTGSAINVWEAMLLAKRLLTSHDSILPLCMQSSPFIKFILHPILELGSLPGEPIILPATQRSCQSPSRLC